MSNSIFNQTCEVDEETVEFYFKATRNWSNPPSIDKIREDLKNPLKHVNYMYPEAINFVNGDNNE